MDVAGHGHSGGTLGSMSPRFGVHINPIGRAKSCVFYIQHSACETLDLTLSWVPCHKPLLTRARVRLWDYSRLTLFIEDAHRAPTIYLHLFGQPE